jgi:hypothetical protein
MTFYKLNQKYWGVPLLANLRLNASGFMGSRFKHENIWEVCFNVKVADIRPIFSSWGGLLALVIASRTSERSEDTILL